MTPEEIRKQMMGSVSAEQNVADFSNMAKQIITDAVSHVGGHGPIIIDEAIANETALEILDIAIIDPEHGTISKVTLTKGAAVIRVSAKNADEHAKRVDCLRRAIVNALGTAHC